MADYPRKLGPISSVLIENGFTFDRFCNKCGNKPVWVKIIGGRTCEIKIKGILKHEPTGQVFIEESASINMNGHITMLSYPEHTQSVLNAQGLANIPA